MEALELDLSKLEASSATGRGDVFLLCWLSECEKAVETLAEPLLLAKQAELTSTLLNLLIPSPLPTLTVKPGRPARALIARILIIVLKRGERKNLFDLGQSLLKAFNGSETKGAPEREKEWRVAAAWVLGEVWTAFGDQVSYFLGVIQSRS